MSDIEEWFVDDRPSYLTMARIMAKELEKFQKKNVWGKGYIGHREIEMKKSFEAGFMAGFSGRYFEQND